ncbi:response regulator [Candidatus Parcubacteria bacterium]|nr:response regulator [Patescibacteria group bacterium]MBU4309636.1 response regulator [Patescibacteria group bacterium]MBU4432567.1 response regulator [Patescibacteria group bacterium]MBU4577976.1 response regulator [Patescibacteria group bacterium]MCG2696515.1 response regulator [Candidatus Parcubacteria bacterium]
MPSFNHKTKILIIENENTARTMARGMLNRMGYLQVDEAEDGEIAWNKILTNEHLKSVRPMYELILCDLDMPNMSGLDLLNKVRLDIRFKNIPFIMITGHTAQRHVVAAAAVGVDDYLIKPLTENLLQASLKKAYEKFIKRQKKLESVNEKIFKRP